jgi:hypothetical protein
MLNWNCPKSSCLKDPTFVSNNKFYLLKSNSMKHLLRVLTLLLLAVLPLTLTGQTLVVEYMKVQPGMEGTYLEVEKAWKEVHQKRIEKGMITGWQLWRNVYAAANDPYEYVTINWYKDWAHSLAPAPEGFWEEMGTLTGNELMAKTGDTRVIVERRVTHAVHAADNNAGAKYILVNQMKVKPGMTSEYLEFEKEMAKPVFEEAIRRGQRSSWGVWQNWPYGLGEITLATVDGYESIEQMTKGGENLWEVVHPEKNLEEMSKKIEELRTMASVELWELVDSVWPE